VNLFVAIVAQADKVPSFPVRRRIIEVFIQGQVRPLPEVIDVVNRIGPPVSVILRPTVHALKMIRPKNFFADRKPTRPSIKPVNVVFRTPRRESFFLFGHRRRSLLPVHVNREDRARHADGRADNQ